MDRYIRLVNPTEEQLQAAFEVSHQEMFQHLDDPPPALPNFATLAQHPFGVLLHQADTDDDASFALLVARWSDPLHRAHWSIGVDDDSRTFLGPDWPEEQLEWFVTGEHPLLYLAAPLATGYLRSQDGAWHLRVCCRCGVVGSPESIGWMGQECGPCFDREQEGERVATSDPTTSVDLLLALRNHGLITATHEGPSRVVQCRDPFTLFPRWSVPLDNIQRVTANDHQVVVRAHSTLWSLDPRDGRTLATFDAGANLKAAVPLGADRVLTLHPRLLKFWNLEAEPTLVHSVGLRHPAHWHLAVSPDQLRIAVCTTGSIETFDTRGTAGERYVAQPPGAIDYAEWLPDGGLLGVRRTGHTARLFRWQASPAPGGFFARWLGRDGVAPIAQSVQDDCRHLRVTPCGHYALYTGSNGDMTLVETRTLQGLARFQFARRSDRLARDLNLSLAPDGRVFLTDGRRIVAYLWRELFDLSNSD